MEEEAEIPQVSEPVDTTQIALWREVTADMGYEHWWMFETTEMPEGAFRGLTEDAKILFHTDVPLANGMGEPGTAPELGDDYICFNGVGDDAGTPFFFTELVNPEQTVRTEHKPYDDIVMLMMLRIIHHYNGVIRVQSTAIETDIEWLKPRAMYTKIFGEIPPQLSLAVG